MIVILDTWRGRVARRPIGAELVPGLNCREALVEGAQGKASEVTVLLQRLRSGDRDVVRLIVDALYQELHALAARHMRREVGHHTLQATALVNEAYLRLLDGPEQINDRNHFLALAATAMRRALVDHARQKRAQKRGGVMERVTLDGMAVADVPLLDVLSVDEALTALAALDERAARVVELRFFGGYTDEEIAGIVRLSLPTIRRDWKFAKSWLRSRLRTNSSAVD